MQKLNPAVLWDLEPVPDANLPGEIGQLLRDRSEIEDHLVTEVLLPYRGEIKERRSKDAEIKEPYELRSLNHLIQESNQKLLDYERRSQAGEDMGAATRQEERNLSRPQQRHEELQKEIRLERNVTVNEPRVLGVAALVPAPKPATLEYATPDGGAKEAHDEGGGAEYQPSRNGSTPDAERFVEGQSIFASGFEIPEEQWRSEMREDEKGPEGRAAARARPSSSNARTTCSSDAKSEGAVLPHKDPLTE